MKEEHSSELLSIHNSGVQIVPENSKVHAAEISRESIRLGSSIRGAGEEMREREAWATWESKAGQKEGGERRLSLSFSLALCM